MFRCYLSLLCTALFCTAIAQPVKMHGRLKVVGTRLIDEHNRPHGYANLMYTMHFYAGKHKEWLRDRADAAIAAGLPVFISESGGMDVWNGPIDYKEWQAYIDWINKNNLSWMSWAVIDKKETDAVLYPSASSTGHLRGSDLTEYGVKIREYLRAYRSVRYQER